MNHWLSIDPPSTVAAGEVNAAEVWIGRARSCQDERGRLQNILAVDFFADGDLFAVVDELNGIGVG